ncbi:hypothetical protein KR200_000844 [Drosophila serrata]|nr:hypothetical protein KR200_000844 [Drosophila serrata]
MGAVDFVNKEIKELLQNGIIRPSRSPYNSPTWVVDKKGTDDNGIKKKRLVIDFRKLNERTIADRYPMPSIPKILANLGKAKFFITLDLRSGYHQTYLAEKHLEKTSFSVNGGKYEFCRLPFGLKNAGSIFQRAFDDVLREEIGKIGYVYVGDVIVFSENETDHVKHIDTVLKRLLDANMRAVINDSVYLNLNYSVNKSPGIAASPLINITGHDHILSLPLLQRMNEHNLRLMQKLRDDVSGGGSPKIWFAAGVAVSLTLIGLILLQQHCRREREACQLQMSIDELAVTEDGVKFKGGVVNNQLPA